MSIVVAQWDGESVAHLLGHSGSTGVVDFGFLLVLCGLGFLRWHDGPSYLLVRGERESEEEEEEEEKEKENWGNDSALLDVANLAVKGLIAY